VCAPAGSKPVRAVRKDRFVDGRQDHRQRVLHDFVLDRRDADGSRLPGSFGDVHPTDGLVPVLATFHPLVQRSEVSLQTLPVLLLADPVHAHGRVLANAVERFLQQLLIDDVRDRAQLDPRVPFRSLSYLQ
jgi:hypothetical protein